MIGMRQGEKGLPPLRSERFFKLDYYWYYITREGVSIGPFDSLDGAKHGCMDFIKALHGEDPSLSDTLQQYRHLTS